MEVEFCYNPIENRVEVFVRDKDRIDDISLTSVINTPKFKGYGLKVTLTRTKLGYYIKVEGLNYGIQFWEGLNSYDMKTLLTAFYKKHTIREFIAKLTNYLMERNFLEVLDYIMEHNYSEYYINLDDIKEDVIKNALKIFLKEYFDLEGSVVVTYKLGGKYYVSIIPEQFEDVVLIFSNLTKAQIKIDNQVIKLTNIRNIETAHKLVDKKIVLNLLEEYVDIVKSIIVENENESSSITSII